MDLNFSDAHQQFRDELRQWLDENDPGPPPRDLVARFEFIRAWQKHLYHARWAAPHWPAAYGGRDAGIVEQVIYHEEFASHRLPASLAFIGISLCGPTLIRHGSDEQRARHLPRILSGEDIWCQGFSEPGAGSDLAAVRTRAELDGDRFVLNGQKVWTSGGQVADWMFLLARTDPDAERHAGISYLLLDMRSPGVEVRPIRQITGESEFCEVFFTDVSVPRANLVGELHGGWAIAHTTLGHERGTAFLGNQIRYRRIVGELVELARTMDYGGGPAHRHPVIRDALARSFVEMHIMGYTGFRMLTNALRRGGPGPEGSANRLFTASFEQSLHETAVRLQGSAGLLVRGAEGAVQRGRWQTGYLRTRASTIGAGTAEIQRNIIAERVLGLPEDEGPTGA